jgi:hypothetical protein
MLGRLLVEQDTGVVERLARIETHLEHIGDAIKGMRGDMRGFEDSCHARRSQIYERLDSIGESATVSRVKLGAFVSVLSLLWALVAVWFRQAIGGEVGQ